MRKIKYTVLTLALLLGLAACGQGTTQPPEEQEPVVGAEPEVEEQEKTAEQTEISAEEPNEAEVEIPVLDTIYLYFSDNDLMTIYRVEVEGPYTLDEEGIKNALQSWVTGPKEEGLQGLVPEGVLVQSVEEFDGALYVSFSRELYEANLGSTGEGMMAEQIAMVVEQFGYKEVFVLIDGEVVDSLLGHLDWNEPFIANSPEDYEIYTN
ncbi:spore gernimation protein GerM [Anaerobacillus alkaliphilus]|uniref:Spore gernimation protein GerM n=1 Tax=Anaerobacillus alkaliphilus TaxID=1548597 RepID=A0A4Q0VVB0_9BACI|nr:GerMN domain-containing protein [Anaerobacillus alkaliphilus]RXJ01921.1 spore gernimation protein GerM [Anaerobacillus alkaliphilus]